MICPSFDPHSLIIYAMFYCIISRGYTERFARIVSKITAVMPYILRISGRRLSHQYYQIRINALYCIVIWKLYCIVAGKRKNANNTPSRFLFLMLVNSINEQIQTVKMNKSLLQKIIFSDGPKVTLVVDAKSSHCSWKSDF